MSFAHMFNPTRLFKNIIKACHGFQYVPNDLASQKNSETQCPPGVFSPPTQVFVLRTVRL